MAKNKRQRAGQKLSDAPLMAIDIGSSNLKIIAGYVNPDGQVEIVGFATCPSRGVTNGAVTDISLLSATLTNLVHEFVDNYRFSISQCIVGVPGNFILSNAETGTATVQNGIVTALDCDNAVENAKAGVNIGADYEIIHTIPQNYITPTSGNVPNPLGQYAKRLEVQVQIISCKQSHVMNLRQVISSIHRDMAISNFVYNGISSTSAVLSEGDKEIGVLHIDIGGGTVNVTVYDNKHLIMAFGVAYGGDDITMEIAKKFGLQRELAEKIKCEYGMAAPEYLKESEQQQVLHLSINDYYSGQSYDNVVNRYELCETIKSGLAYLIMGINDEITRFCVERNISLSLGAGIVISGGVAKTPFISELFYDVLIQHQANYLQLSNGRIKIGVPRGVQLDSNQDGIIRPENATAVGLLRYVQSERTVIERSDRKQPSKPWYKRLRDWFTKEFAP